jgi:hypothetical protein
VELTRVVDVLVFAPPRPAVPPCGRAACGSAIVKRRCAFRASPSPMTRLRRAVRSVANDNCRQHAGCVAS